MRTIDMLFDNDDIVVATEGNGIPLPVFQQAVGRLCTWADYPHVTLHLNTDGEIIAVYSADDGERKYVIGAVWHHDATEENGGHYGFHS